MFERRRIGHPRCLRTRRPSPSEPISCCTTSKDAEPGRMMVPRRAAYATRRERTTGGMKKFIRETWSDMSLGPERGSFSQRSCKKPRTSPSCVVKSLRRHEVGRGWTTVESETIRSRRLGLGGVSAGAMNRMPILSFLVSGQRSSSGSSCTSSDSERRDE